VTWDHIEMFVNVGIASGVVGCLAALGVAFVPHFRHWLPCAAAFLFSIFVSAPIFSALIADTHMSAESAEYPPMVDAFYGATPRQQMAMRQVILEAGSRREVFSMSRAQRDRFLKAGNFCTPEGYAGCRPLPRGSMDQGGAIEVFPSLGSPARPCVHVPQRPSCT
jgi:hypothetical protein